VGTVLAQGQSLVLPRVADDQRFLDRLSLYDCRKDRSSRAA
jgi:Nif-specific regulatory protein